RRPGEGEVSPVPRRRVAPPLQPSDLRGARSRREGPRGRLPGEVRRVLLERADRGDPSRRLREGFGRPAPDGLPRQARGVRRAPPAPRRVLRGRRARRDLRAGSPLRGRPGRGVVARERGGEDREIRAKVVVDASGQWAFLSGKLGTRRFDRKLKRAAVFAHYEGVPRPAGRQAGDILLPIDDGVWYWIIPFSDGTASVGAVFHPVHTRGPEGEDLEARFERLIARSARMPGLLAGGRRTSKVFGISDYSASSAKLAGDGYVLVGDAATFLDPVFSTGVFL